LGLKQDNKEYHKHLSSYIYTIKNNFENDNKGFEEVASLLSAVATSNFDEDANKTFFILIFRILHEENQHYLKRNNV